MDQLFCIGGFCFRLIYPDTIVPPPNFMLFAVRCQEAGQQENRPVYTYTMTVSETFPEPAGQLAAERPDLKVYRQGELEQRLIGVKGQPGFYACYTEVSGTEARIILSPEWIDGLRIDPVFTSLLALERRMITRDSMILHCAYMELNGEAVLFSAPSETGKTTQAGLWEQYRKTRTVNGDRALLRAGASFWTACGWPVCGTSEVCHNEAMPIRAIVMLSQGRSNEIRRLGAGEAFRLLYTQITVNSWNRESVVHTMDLIDKLVSRVPVFHLSCTISEAAVSCLEQALNTP